jgi:hypothetical protein
MERSAFLSQNLPVRVAPASLAFLAAMVPRSQNCTSGYYLLQKDDEERHFALQAMWCCGMCGVGIESNLPKKLPISPSRRPTMNCPQCKAVRATGAQEASTVGADLVMGAKSALQFWLCIGLKTVCYNTLERA